jgi:hypothetical protein
MQFGKAFTFVFEDPKWLQKVGIAALISLIPLVGQLVVLGWGLEVTRRVINNDSEPLPDFTNFVEYLVRGLKGFVISLVYVLPIILVVICVQTAGLGFASGNGNQDSDAMGYAVLAVTLCLSCFAILYGIAVGLLLPVAFGNFAATDQLGAAFRFGELIRLFRANPVAYLLTLVGMILASFISSLGAIACVVGALVTSAYAVVINGHLWGQAYSVARNK